jgi:hypothetical protein
LLIGKAPADPELIGGIEERDCRGHPFLGRCAESVLDLLLDDLLLRDLELIASGRSGARPHGHTGSLSS